MEVVFIGTEVKQKEETKMHIPNEHGHDDRRKDAIKHAKELAETIVRQYGGDINTIHHEVFSVIETSFLLSSVFEHLTIDKTRDFKISFTAMASLAVTNIINNSKIPNDAKPRLANAIYQMSSYCEFINEANIMLAGIVFDGGENGTDTE